MSDLKNIIKKHSIQAKKSLGQNFIYDKNILSEIASTQKADSVCLEIGCGPGGLTLELAKVCKKVIGIEIDKKFQEVYKEYLVKDNIEIIFNDFMKMDIDELYEKYVGEPFSVCANLPYYITTPILMRLLDSNLPVESITILVQKEVADRIISSPNSKQYGVLSIMTQARGTAEKIFNLQPGSFLPSPNVVSSLIKITLQENKIKSNINDFRKCVRTAFSSRRKQLKNNISISYNISKEKVSNILNDLQINENSRAENLSVEDFDKLTYALVNN